MANYSDFHTSTVLEEINIVAKNFTLPLNESNKIAVKDFSILVEDTINAEVDEAHYLLIKSISVTVLSTADKKLADLKVLYTFSVQRTYEYITQTQNDISFTVNIDFNDWLNDVVLATTRGIMYSEYRGTFMDKTLLPLVRHDYLR